MTILISGGDSFTYGSELLDCPHGKHYSQKTWAPLLADKLDMNYCCTAWPGYANSAIRRKVMNTVEKYKQESLFVAVMWSFPNRYEFRFSYDTGQRESPWYCINPWTHEQVDPKEHYVQHHHEVLDQHNEARDRAEKLGISNFARSFVKNVATTEYWEVYQSLLDIVLLQNYIKVRNIPYLFTLVDSSLLNNVTMQQPDSTILTLKKDIDWNNWFFLGENYLGMYEWSKQQKFPFYTTHPKELAHEEFIKKLLTNRTKESIIKA